MDPARVWKTLNLRGPLTARGVAAAQAVVAPSQVRPGAWSHVADLIEFLDDQGLVAPVDDLDAGDEYDVETQEWVACPLPADRKPAQVFKQLRIEWRERSKEDA